MDHQDTDVELKRAAEQLAIAQSLTLNPLECYFYLKTGGSSVASNGDKD